MIFYAFAGIFVGISAGSHPAGRLNSQAIALTYIATALILGIILGLTLRNDRRRLSSRLSMTQIGLFAGISMSVIAFYATESPLLSMLLIGPIFWGIWALGLQAGRELYTLVTNSPLPRDG